MCVWLGGQHAQMGGCSITLYTVTLCSFNPYFTVASLYLLSCLSHVALLNFVIFFRVKTKNLVICNVKMQILAIQLGYSILVSCNIQRNGASKELTQDPFLFKILAADWSQNQHTSQLIVKPDQVHKRNLKNHIQRHGSVESQKCIHHMNKNMRRQ